VNREKVKECFLKDTAKHSMVIEKDDGVFRHIVFSNNGSSVYKFRLTTFPGYLVVSGDMGEWIFSRIYDMFNFFGDSKEKLSINPSYWSEKLDASKDGYSEFSERMFSYTVNRDVKEYINENDVDDDKMKEIKEELEFMIGDANEYNCYEKMHEFDYNLDLSIFQYSFEYSFKEYTHHYLWACFAVVWGINKYNESKEV